MSCYVCWGRTISRLNFINVVNTFYIYIFYIALRMLGRISQLQQSGQCAVASEEFISLIHGIPFVKPAKSSILHFLCCSFWLCCFYCRVSICYCRDSNILLDTCVWWFGNLPVIVAMNCLVFVIHWLMKFIFSTDLDWQRKPRFPGKRDSFKTTLLPLLSIRQMLAVVTKRTQLISYS